jgi:ubiquinol-cytochrome c reductase cytochrome c subunit
LGIAVLGTLALVFPGVAQASTTKTQSVSASVKACGTVNLKGVSGVHNTGNPFKSTKLVCFDGMLIRYGDSAVTYANPPKSDIAAGKLLFDQTCSSCHGSQANGVSPTGQATIGPNLQGVGAATVDFWITTGRMPATDIRAVEAERKPPRLTDAQALKVAAYINSLDPSVPAVPTPNLKGANLADGADLFSLNCAACHTITGAGDALAFGTNAPSLQDKEVTPQQVAEALRIGPANMPRFSGNLSDDQVRDVVAYVTQKIQHPQNPGGVGLGGVGPVAEGFIALLLGVGGLALICFWIGERS